MQSNYSYLVFGLFIFLSACGTEPDERVYGTWVEPLTGEKIDFRSDGTLGWFGHEGSFAFKKSTNWASCLGRSGCPTGQVAIDVDGQNFRISYYSHSFDENPDEWYISFRSLNAMPYEATVKGKTTGGFQILREGTVTTPYVPNGFSRMDGGLTALHSSATGMQNYNGEIVGKVNGKVRRYNTETAEWDLLAQPEADWHSWGALADQVFYNTDEYSLDGGSTWKSMPELEGDNLEGSPVAFGTSLYASLRKDENDEPNLRQIWKVDLSATSPSWVKVGEMNAEDYSSRELLAIPSANTLIRTARMEEGGFQLEISTNFGVTFESLASNCDRYPKAHLNGLYCEKGDKSVAWYDLTTGTWSTIAIAEGDRISPPSHLRDALYLVRNDSSLLKISPNGTETVVADFGTGAGYRGSVYILEHHIVLKKLTLWVKAL